MWSNVITDTLQSIARFYDTSSTYDKKAIVWHDGDMFQAKVDGITGDWDASKWDEIILSDVDRFITAGEPWDKTKAYHFDDIVQKDDKLWKCGVDDATIGSFETGEGGSSYVDLPYSGYGLSSSDTWMVEVGSTAWRVCDNPIPYSLFGGKANIPNEIKIKMTLQNTDMGDVYTDEVFTFTKTDLGGCEVWLETARADLKNSFFLGHEASGQTEGLYFCKKWVDSATNKLIYYVANGKIAKDAPAEWSQYYVKLADMLQAGKPWDKTKAYVKDDVVQKDGKLYKCIVANAEVGAFTISEVSESLVGSNDSMGSYENYKFKNLPNKRWGWAFCFDIGEVIDHDVPKSFKFTGPKFDAETDHSDISNPYEITFTTWSESETCFKSADEEWGFEMDADNDQEWWLCSLNNRAKLDTFGYSVIAKSVTPGDWVQWYVHESTGGAEGNFIPMDKAGKPFTAAAYHYGSIITKTPDGEEKDTFYVSKNNSYKNTFQDNQWDKDDTLIDAFIPKGALIGSYVDDENKLVIDSQTHPVLSMGINAGDCFWFNNVLYVAKKHFNNAQTITSLSSTDAVPFYDVAEVAMKATPLDRMFVDAGDTRDISINGSKITYDNNFDKILTATYKGTEFDGLTTILIDEDSDTEFFDMSDKIIFKKASFDDICGRFGDDWYSFNNQSYPVEMKQHAICFANIGGKTSIYYIRTVDYGYTVNDEAEFVAKLNELVASGDAIKFPAVDQTITSPDITSGWGRLFGVHPFSDASNFIYENRVGSMGDEYQYTMQDFIGDFTNYGAEDGNPLLFVVPSSEMKLQGYENEETGEVKNLYTSLKHNVANYFQTGTGDWGVWRSGARALFVLTNKNDPDDLQFYLFHDSGDFNQKVDRIENGFIAPGETVVGENYSVFLSRALKGIGGGASGSVKKETSAADGYKPAAFVDADGDQVETVYINSNVSINPSAGSVKADALEFNDGVITAKKSASGGWIWSDN